MSRGKGPLGYFVHHQGRGHAERAAAIANALAPQRRVTLFCAKPDSFPELAEGVMVEKDTIVVRDYRERPRRTGVSADAANAALCTRGVAHDHRCRGSHHRLVSSGTSRLVHHGRFSRIGPTGTDQFHSARGGAPARHRTDPGHQACYDGAAGLLARTARHWNSPIEQPRCCARPITPRA